MTLLIGENDATAVDLCVAALRAGRCIAVPTDTVYGIAAPITDLRSVQALFDLKGRDDTKAVAVLVGSWAEAMRLGQIDSSIFGRFESFWPGPLTIVVHRCAGVDADLGGDPSTIGLRWAASRLVDEIIGQVGPLVTTSANISGNPTLQSAVEIAEAFGSSLDVIVDGGIRSGTASTVIDLRGGDIAILREGAIAAELLISSAISPTISQTITTPEPRSLT